MADAPWPFDLADLAPAVLLFGHLGPVIADNWDSIYAQEAVQATTKEMRDLYNKLPVTLTKKQRLSLKPMVDLSDDEKSFLLATYGSTTNPIVRYFQAKSTTFLSNHRPPKVHTPPLPLPLSPIDIELLAKEIFEGELPLLSDDESDDDFQDEDGSLGDGLDDFEVSIIQGTLDADIVDEEEEEDSLPAISESQLTDADEQAVGNAIDSVDEGKLLI
jgi:hypothetical protein